jgi:hypothetical protein
MTMRRMLMPIGALGTMLWVGLAAPLAAPAGPDQGACEQIKAACQRAGFARGAARTGSGLQRDCIGPIMQGAPPPARASKPLPHIDSQLVSACQTSDPSFGQGRVPPAQPAPASPPPLAPAAPATAVPNTPPPAAASGGKRPNIVFILTDDLA